MRILVISAALPPVKAGDTDYTLHLCRHLANEGLDVHILTSAGNLKLTDWPFRVYPLIRDWSWSDLLRLSRFTKNSGADAVLLFYTGWIYNYHPMITFIPSLCKKALPHSSFVTQFGFDDGSVPFNMSFFARAVRKAIAQRVGTKDVDYSFGTLLRDSDRIIVLSDLHRFRLSERFSGVAKKSVLIPPPPLMNIRSENGGQTRELSRQQLRIDKDDFVIAFFGYAYRGKGIDTLLKAFRLVSDKRTNTRLILIGGLADSREGSSYAQEMVDLCRELKIEEKVIWRGGYSWETDEGSFCLRAADLCVLPFDDGVTMSRSSLAAAVAHGLPVVTTKGLSLEHQFRDRKNVLLCTPKDAKSLADAIDSVMSNPELSTVLRAGALQLADEWFSWDKAIERMIDALKSAA